MVLLNGAIGQWDAPSFVVSLLTAILGRWTSIFIKRKPADPFDQGTLVCPGWDWLFRICVHRLYHWDWTIFCRSIGLESVCKSSIKWCFNVLHCSALRRMISLYILVSVSQLSWYSGGMSCKACWLWHVYLWAQAQHRAFVPQLYGRSAKIRQGVTFCGVKRPCDWPDESPQAHTPMHLTRWQHLRKCYDTSYCLYMYAIRIFIGLMIIKNYNSNPFAVFSSQQPFPTKLANNVTSLANG